MTRVLPRAPRANRCGFSPRSITLLLLLASAAPRVAHAESVDLDGSRLLCPLVLHERQRDLEDARFKLELTENEYLARKRLFVMIDKLWEARSIERELYLDYKRLRDRTWVRSKRLETRIAQLDSETKQVALACDQGGKSQSDASENEPLDTIAKKIDVLQAEYRRLDCELLARDLEIAAIDHEFDRAVLEATRAFIEGRIKSRYELVIDEFAHDQSKARVESFATRARACRKRLEQSQ